MATTKNTTPLCPTPSVMIVDIEGYQIDHEFIIKELALYDPFTMSFWVGTFQPPYSLNSLKKRVTDRIERSNTHGLTWNEGQYSYFLLGSILQAFAGRYSLYAHGMYKCHIIQNIINCSVGDLCAMDFPSSVYDLPFAAFCHFHDSTKQTCALDKAARLGQRYVNLFSMKC